MSQAEVPDEIKLIAHSAKQHLLPRKSKELYEEAYNIYKKWCIKMKITKTCEDSILAYFNSHLSKYKSSTLWTKYSMLRSTINLKEGIDISKFPSVIPFLKRKAEGYKPKKSLSLTKENVDRFLTEADDENNLFNKVWFGNIMLRTLKHEIIFLGHSYIWNFWSLQAPRINDIVNK